MDKGKPRKPCVGDIRPINSQAGPLMVQRPALNWLKLKIGLFSVRADLVNQQHNNIHYAPKR